MSSQRESIQLAAPHVSVSPSYSTAQLAQRRSLGGPHLSTRDHFGNYDRSTIYTLNALQQNQSDGVVPSSGVYKLLFHLRYMIPLFHPNGPFIAFKDLIIMVLLIYTSIEVPMTIAFNIELNLGQPFGTVAFIIDCLLLFDIIITLRTAYFDKWDRLRLIINEIDIIKKYLHSWFIFDLITCIPFQLANNLLDNEHNEYKTIFLTLRAIKLLRLIKMIRVFNHFFKQFTDRQFKIGLKLFKLLTSMLYFAHMAACIWWLVGDKVTPSWIDDTSYIDTNNDNTIITLRELGENDNFIRYSYAYYWAVVTLFTTGYGDIVATNVTEQWLIICCVLIGTCFFSYFIGTLTVLITEGDRVKAYRDDLLEDVQHFCDQKKLPKEMSRAIITHTRYHCNYNYAFNESEILLNLPPHLQTSLHTYLASHILNQIDIFKDISLSILGQIALSMKSISCNEGFQLYCKGDRAKYLFIQRTGTSTLELSNGKIIQLRRGNVCGENALILPKRKHTVTCQTWSEFYILSVNDILLILQSEYPSSWRKKWRLIVKNIRGSKKTDIRKIDFNKNKSQTQNEAEESALNLFLNQPSTIQTKRYHGQSSIRTNYNGKLPKEQKKKDKEKEKNKKKKNKKNDDDELNKSGSYKSFIPSFLITRRDSFHRDLAVSNAYFRRKDTMKSIPTDDGKNKDINTVNVDANNEDINMYSNPDISLSMSTSNDSDNESNDVVPGFSYEAPANKNKQKPDNLSQHTSSDNNTNSDKILSFMELIIDDTMTVKKHEYIKEDDDDDKYDKENIDNNIEIPIYISNSPNSRSQTKSKIKSKSKFKSKSKSKSQTKPKSKSKQKSKPTPNKKNNFIDQRLTLQTIASNTDMEYNTDDDDMDMDNNNNNIPSTKAELKKKLLKLNKKELINKCKEYKIMVTGNKAEMVNKLVDKMIAISNKKNKLKKKTSKHPKSTKSDLQTDITSYFFIVCMYL